MQTLRAVVAILDNSLMEVAFVIVQKTDSMTAVDFVVVLKIDCDDVLCECLVRLCRGALCEADRVCDSCVCGCKSRLCDNGPWNSGGF